MEKHTPGPWDVYIGEDRDVIAVSKWIDGPNGGKMAISLARLPDPKKHLSQEEINANGYLMAAAPKMREALKDVRRFIKAELDVRIASHTIGGGISTLDEQDGGLVGEAMQCLERIDAALGKAEGV